MEERAVALVAKDVYNDKGEPIGGVYQFLLVLRRIIEENLYHKVFVFWDGKFSGKMRWEIYKDYKGNRDKDYENGTEPEDQNEILQRRYEKVINVNICGELENIFQMNDSI